MRVFVSPLFALKIAGVSFRTRTFGIPFVNRTYDVMLHNGTKFDDWSEFVIVATNSYLGKYLDKAKAYSFGWVDASPRDMFGAAIDLEATYTTAPFEYELLAEYLSTRGFAHD